MKQKECPALPVLSRVIALTLPATTQKVFLKIFPQARKDSFESLEGLMSAIYHRFGFLDFTKNEIGISLSKADKGFNFVYNMGNNSLNHFCQFTIYMNEGPFYEDICKQKGKISAHKFDQIKEGTVKKNPPLVVWPPDAAEQIPAVFYEEIPDPLPDLAVSGYPVSIQFNPAYFKHVRLIDFKLFNTANDREVTPTRLMRKKNDPNQQFTAYQFALFPIHPLNRATTYRVETEFMTDGEKVDKNWIFTTRTPRYPMFVINAERENLFLEPNITYAVYIPPSNKNPYIGPVHWETSSKILVDLVTRDRNTMLISLSGEKCWKVQFTLQGGRSFSLQLSDRDNLNGNNYYSPDSELLCVTRRVGDMKGFSIKAQGEILKIESDQDYWVKIESSDNASDNVKTQFMDGMRVKIDHLSRNIFKIRLSGLPGQSASFFLNNSKSFKAVLSDGN